MKDLMNKQSSHFLSLIVPVYRQEATIVNNILELKLTLDKIRYKYEIIAVIDGLQDNSYQLLKRKKIPGLKCIAYTHNHGKSYAIRCGMHEAKGDYIMFLDAGSEINPNGISMLLEHMEWYRADIIVGSKRHPASIIHYSLARKILSTGYHILVRSLFHLNINDTQAGIKIFKKDVLARVLPRLVEKRFAGDLELLVVAQMLGFKRIYEAPIRLDYHLAQITSAATIRSIWGMFQDTLAIFYRAKILRYYSQRRFPRFSFPEGTEIHKTA